MDRIFNDGVFVPLLVFTAVVLYVIVKTVGRTIASVAREHTKREVSAYVAEGTITPENAERLIKAGDKDAQQI